MTGSDDAAKLTEDHFAFLDAITEDIAEAKEKAATWMLTATASHLARHFQISQLDAEAIVLSWTRTP